METRIILDEELDSLKKIYDSNKCSIYDSGKKVIKIFKDEYVKMMGGFLLERKLYVSRNLCLPNVALPTTVYYSDKNKLKGIEMDKLNKTFSYNSSSLSICTKRNIDLKNTLLSASEQNVVITDFFQNVGLWQDDTLGIFDYDGMQVCGIPTSSRSSILFKFLENNRLVKDKKYEPVEGLLTTDVNVFNSIVFYFMDCLGLDISNSDNLLNLINYLGIENESINNKILRLFDPTCRNEFFTDDEYNELNEKYTRKSIDVGNNRQIKVFQKL